MRFSYIFRKLHFDVRETWSSGLGSLREFIRKAPRILFVLFYSYAKFFKKLTLDFITSSPDRTHVLV